MARNLSWIGTEAELPNEVFLIRNRGFIGFYRTLKGVRSALKSNYGLTLSVRETRYFGDGEKAWPYSHYTRKTANAVEVYRAKIVWERIDLEPQNGPTEPTFDAYGEYIPIDPPRPCWWCKKPTHRVDIDWGAPYCGSHEDEIGEHLQMIERGSGELLEP